MKKVDFAKLSEQYAGFLVAAGGVSITVLTLVLTLVSSEQDAVNPHQMILEQARPLVYLRTFVAEALMVATACCFIGAHMMAETAAYFTYSKENSLDRPLGERLFLLASTNIFNAVGLLLFALILLPHLSAGVDADRVMPISLSIFVAVAVAALIWMCLAIERRTEILLLAAFPRADAARNDFSARRSAARYVRKLKSVSTLADAASVKAISLSALLTCLAVERRRKRLLPAFVKVGVYADRVRQSALRALRACCAADRNTDKPRVRLACIFIGMALMVFVWVVVFDYFLQWVDLLNMTLFPIGILTVLSLIYSALIFKDDKDAGTRIVGLKETCFFGAAVTIAYTSLLIATYIIL